MVCVIKAGEIEGGSGDTTASDSFDGTDLSGTDGAVNRVLTLANTSLTKNEIVIIGGTGALVPTRDYTASHAAASSTITFLINVWDNDKIYVVYND